MVETRSFPALKRQQEKWREKLKKDIYELMCFKRGGLLTLDRLQYNNSLGEKS